MRESEMEYNERQLKFLSAAIVKYGEGAVMSKEAITETAEEIGLKFPYWLTDTRRLGAFTKVSKDTYRLPAFNGGEGATIADVVTAPVVLPDRPVTPASVETKKAESDTLDMSTYFNPAELIPAKDHLHQFQQ